MLNILVFEMSELTLVFDYESFLLENNWLRSFVLLLFLGRKIFNDRVEILNRDYFQLSNNLISLVRLNYHLRSSVQQNTKNEQNFACLNRFEVFKIAQWVKKLIIKHQYIAYARYAKITANV